MLFILLFQTVLIASGRDSQNNGNIDASQLNVSISIAGNAWIIDNPEASNELITKKDRKSTRLNSSHRRLSRMPSSA